MLSKRLRYEVLRRDRHTCRYCGAAAPDVKLTVDHVIPTALGGSDDPGNLVTACSDCNSGKSSATTDSAIVADVDEKAAQWAAAMRRAADEITADQRFIRSVCERVADILPPHPPTGWKSSVQQLLAAGLPSEVVVDLAHVAMGAGGVKDRWRYYFGCGWARVRKMQDRAAELLDARGDARAHAPSNASSTCSEHCSSTSFAPDAVDSIWRSVNTRHLEVFGFDLPECMCTDVCEFDDPRMCHFAIALYMTGCMDQIDVEKKNRNGAEVDHGTALDPA